MILTIRPLGPNYTSLIQVCRKSKPSGTKAKDIKILGVAFSLAAKVGSITPHNRQCME